MIKKVALFMPPRSQYGVLHHFTVKLAEAFSRQGVSCNVLEAEWNNPKPFLDKIFEDKPDFTLSFNGLLPDDEGRFFCDLIGIPHVAFLVDSQNQFFPLIQSPNTIISCTDRFSCDFFKGVQQGKNILFIPHGVERELAPDKSLGKNYDVVMMSSLMDFQKLREEWRENYPKIITDAMDEAIEMTLSDQDAWYVQSFVYALDRQIELKGAIDPTKINFPTIFDDLELYLKGKSRVDLIRSIHDAEVHVFGSTPGRSWKEILGKDMPNVKVHEAVPFANALEIIKQSKIVLNIAPWIRNGSHERIFVSLACGALPLAEENIYLKENFTSGKDIAMFAYKDLGGINDVVNEYLSNNQKREEIVQKGRAKVMEHHTWDARAKEILQDLGPILENLKK